MQYDLVQYGCDRCGALTEVLDPDEHMPNGWKVVMSDEGINYRHLCPKCVKELNLQ